MRRGGGQKAAWGEIASPRSCSRRTTSGGKIRAGDDRAGRCLDARERGRVAALSRPWKVVAVIAGQVVLQAAL
jgi:hypothetical protein